jgi:hypothetical protein
MRKAEQWVLFTHVPAIKCETCGETAFSQGVAERLAEILAPDSRDVPTGSRWAPEYDFEKLKRAPLHGETPRVRTSSTG